MQLSDEETGLYSLEQGCPIHGDEFMRECSICGTEFCKKCYSRSAMCSDCLAQSADLEEEEDDPDFEDVQDLDALIGEDEEVEKLLREEEDIPMEDLLDEED